MFKIQEVEMCCFMHYGCPFTFVSGYLQDLGHINFHPDTIFYGRGAQVSKIQLPENEYLGGKCRLIERCSVQVTTFFFSPLVSRNEATSMGFFLNTHTVIYTQKKFRWSYSGSQGVTGSPFVRDYYSRRLPGRGINLPWNNTSHNNSKELVSAPHRQHTCSEGPSHCACEADLLIHMAIQPSVRNYWSKTRSSNHLLACCLRSIERSSLFGNLNILRRTEWWSGKTPNTGFK